MDKIVNSEPDFENLPDTNSIQFIEQMYGTFLDEPGSLDPSWVSYFEKISDTLTNKSLHPPQMRPTWSRKDWPPANIGEEIAAFDGQWDKIKPDFLDEGNKKKYHRKLKLLINELVN